MLILGIETATSQVGCAIGGHEGVLASFHSAKGRRHVETLVPAIEFICAQARIELSEISAVAVDVGPGLFSGLRVGVTTAKAIAQALRIPTLGVPSLDLLAFPVRHTNRLIATVVDARRGELFYSFYRQAPGGAQRLRPHLLGTVADLESELLATGEDCLLVGDGALRHREELVVAAGCELAGLTHAFPSASCLVELAHPRALREEFVPASELEPLYLRRSDAEINWELRQPAPQDAG